MADNSSKQPRICYFIEETRNSEKRYWRRIGVAWENRDGSLNVKLFATPTNGEFQIRELEPSDNDDRSDRGRDDRRDTRGRDEGRSGRR